MAEKNMIKEYIGSSADKRVDIIMMPALSLAIMPIVPVSQ